MLVLTLHYSVWIAPWRSDVAPAYFRAVFDTDQLGMTLFFTLSGFVIAYNYLHFNWASKPGEAFVRFIYLRLSRLYPALLVFLAIVSLGPRLKLNDPHAAEWVFIHVASVQSWLPFKVNGELPHGSVFFVAWSISTEIMLYLTFSLAMILWRRRAPILRTFLLAFAACYACFIVFCMWSEPTALRFARLFPMPFEQLTPIELQVWLFNLSPYTRILNFGIGAVPAIAIMHCSGWIDARRSALRHLTTAALAALFVIYLLPTLGEMSGYRVREFGMVNIVTSIAVAVLFVNATDHTTINRWLSSRPLVFLGTISYSLYLLHFIRFPLIEQTDGSVTQQGFALFLANFIAATCFACVLSYGAFTLIEAPAQQALRAWFKKRYGLASIPVTPTIRVPLARPNEREQEPSSVVIYGGPKLIVGILIGFLLAGLAYQYRSAEPTQMVPKGNGINLVWSSENFSNSRWRPEKATIESSVVPPPFGAGGVQQLLEGDGSGAHRIEAVISGVAPGAVHTFSVFVKPAQRSAFMLEARDFEPIIEYGRVGFDLARKVATFRTREIIDAGVGPVGDGWYRCWMAMRFTGERAVVDIGLISAIGDILYEGDVHSGINLWGVQFELGGTPGEYHQTVDGAASALR